MKNNKGFAGISILIVALGIIVLGGGAYVAMNPEVLRAPAEKTAEQNNPPRTAPEQTPSSTTAKSSIVWRFTSAGEINGTEHTNVTVVINNKAYDMGKFAGSCSEIGASGGVDGKGLLIGELSASQCWFAGGGNEIGVFAHEDGGFDLMVGELSEGEEGVGVFRGSFDIKYALEP